MKRTRTMVSRRGPRLLPLSPLIFLDAPLYVTTYINQGKNTKQLLFEVVNPLHIPPEGCFCEWWKVSFIFRSRNCVPASCMLLCGQFIVMQWRRIDGVLFVIGN